MSTTTVSNVLNDRTGAMAPSTRQRVLEAARTLDYRPSQAARSLASRQTATLGLVIAEIATPLFFSAVSSVERVARESNYNVLLCHASTAEEEHAALDLLRQKEVEGVIFLSTSDYRDDGLLHTLAEGLPIVTINRSGTGGAFDRVSWNNEQGIADAVRHLHQLGHTQIAFLRGPARRQSSDERQRGYRYGLAECGLQFNPSYVVTADYTTGPIEWQAATQDLIGLAERPTAVLASDDSVAAVVMRTLQIAGVRVPEDIALVGVDDQSFAPLLNPALTTVRLPVLEAGQTAISLLLERLRGVTRPAARVVLPMTLVVRESCGTPPSNDRGENAAGLDST